MNPPKLQALPRDDFLDGWKIFCGYCNDFHLHGRGLGHRVAHCNNRQSPYNKTGYVLVRKR